MRNPILTIAGLILAPVLYAQNATGGAAGGADPFAAAGGGAVAPGGVVDETPVNLSLRYETFSLPLADAAALQRKNLADPQLYQALLEKIAKKEAVQESFTVLRTRSGEKAVAESITETIYPTSWDPSELPNSVSLSVSGDAAKPAAVESTGAAAATEGVKTQIMTPSQPKELETRNEGVTFEVEPTLDQTRTIVDLRCVPDHVNRVGSTLWGQGNAQIETPQFESQRVNTGVTVGVGRPFLLGTVNRPPASKLNADAGPRIWFAFVTADLVRP